MTLHMLVAEDDDEAAGETITSAGITDCVHERASVPTITVTRSEEGLRVHIVGLDAPTAEERQYAIARITTALHLFDRSVRTIDIVLKNAQSDSEALSLPGVVAKAP